MEVAIRRMEQMGMAVAGVSMIAIMLTISADALGRYALKSPLPWAFDVVSYYLMIMAAYLVLSDTYRNGDHISITILRPLMSRTLRAGVDIIWNLLALGVFVVVTYGASNNLTDAFRGRQFLPGYVQWPVWLSYLPIVIGAAILVLRLAHHCLMLATRGDDPFVHAEGDSFE